MSRFSEPQHPAFSALNDSIGFDRRLGPYDVAQSRAHASMLAAQGIISEPERDMLHRGLDASRASSPTGRSRSPTATRTSTWRSSAV